MASEPVLTEASGGKCNGFWIMQHRTLQRAVRLSIQTNLWLSGSSTSRSFSTFASSRLCGKIYSLSHSPFVPDNSSLRPKAQSKTEAFGLFDPFDFRLFSSCVGTRPAEGAVLSSKFPTTEKLFTIQKHSPEGIPIVESANKYNV